MKLPEKNTSSHKSKAIIMALMASSCFVSSGSALAQLKPANTATTVVNAPNGVPVVNIANPNSAGLSNNLFTSYNVGSNGVVLDNQDTAVMQVQSKLAGAVSANTNLTSEATVILNQVVSTNSSVLAGYTEVVGGTADVVVANPNGITCSGCGFINIPKVTLTTGVPVINGGTGALSGFNVNAGDILITGQGLNASTTDYIALFARSLEIQGQINAHILDIAAGANNIGYTAGGTGYATVNPLTPTGTAPTLSIDSSALGGMYADRIRLIATEAGVGVRMLGDAAAGVGDFTLTASGQVDLENTISAQGNLQISSADTSLADAIKLTDATLSSQGDMSLTATGGNIHLIGSALTSQGNLTLQSLSLTDDADISGITSNNERYAAGALTLDQTGAATLDGTSFSTDTATGGALSITAGSLSIEANGEALYGHNSLQITSNGDLSLANASLLSPGNLSLTSTTGQISTTAATGEGIESTAGNITFSAATGINNAGAVSADVGSLAVYTNNSIINSGSLEANTTGTFADLTNGATENITNSGTIGVSGDLTVKATALTNGSSTNSAALIQGGNGSTFTVATLDNYGTVTGSANGTGATIVNANTLTNENTGIIQSVPSNILSVEDLTLNVADTFTNDYKILATGDLDFLATGTGNLAITNNAAGVLQAGGTLTTNGGGGAYNINNAGTVLGDTLALNILVNLSNTGIIQGGTGASVITFITPGTLSNSAAGDIKLGTTSAGSGTISAGTIADDGIIESEGALTLYASNAIGTAATTGEIISAGDLTMRGLSSSDYTVNNNGLIQSTGGVLDIKGQNGSSAVIIQAPTANALFAGNTVDWNADTISFEDHNIGVKSTGDLTIAANSLSFTSTDDYLLAGNNGTLSLANGLSDNASIFGVNGMTVSAPSITITSTGGLASGGALTASSTVGDFTNNGAIYADGVMTLQASGNFTNGDAGTINGNSDITLMASNTFTNNNNINAAANLTVTAPTILNEVTGGDTRYWTTLASSTTSTGFGSDPSDLLWGQNTSDYYTETWTEYQSYGTTPTHKPELVAGSTLAINGFTSTLNLGGIMSGSAVNITGQSGATFTNDDYGLTTKEYTETWSTYVSCCGGTFDVDLEYYYDQNDTTSYTTNNPPPTSFGGGIYANMLTASSFSLTNLGSPNAANVTPKNAPTTGTGSSVGSTGASSITGATSFTLGGLTITLPTNPNGYFIINPNPLTGPLIETNPLYAVGSSFLGANYMIQTYGVDPDTVDRELGDANYQASLIQQQVLNAGAGALLGTTNQAAAMQQLMDNGVTVGKSLGLTIGTAPTAAQIANLSTNMVWMVDTVVDGQHVLAPVVYLSQQTKSQIASGAVIQATNVNMQLTSLTNTGGTISGSGNMNITTQGNITNTSGTISGGNLALTSTGGDIINQTLVTTTGGVGNQQTTVGNTAGILATGNLSLNAANNITNLGANMSAGGNASLNAGNNITFDTVLNQQSSQTQSGQNGSFTGGTRTSGTSSSITNIVSGLTVGGNLSTNSGNDTTFAGTNVGVGGNANLNAGGNLNILARNNSTTTTSSSTSGTVFSGNSTNTSDTETTNVGTNFNIGGNLNSNSGKDTNIVGSNVTVAGNGSMNAGGNLNILAGQNTSNTLSSTTNTGAGVGGGVYGTQTTTNTDQKSTSVASNLNFGGNGSLTANSGAVTVQGSNVGAGGNLNVNAQTVNVLAAQNTDVSTNTVSTTTLFSTGGSNSASGNSGTNTNYTPTAQQTGMGQVPTNAAGANASAGENASAQGLTLTNTTTTSTTDSSSTSAGSSLKSGGNMTVNSTGDTTLQGATVAAGGDASVNAGGNLNILAAQNTNTVTTSTDSASVGLYASSQNAASSGANGGYGATGTGLTSGYAASGTAGGQASSNNQVNLVDVNKSSTTTTDITNTGTTITSGGNTSLGATNDINIVGSSVNAAGNLSTNAGGNLNVTAAQNSHTVTTGDSDTTAGLYANGSANASATGSATDGSKYGGVDTQAGGTGTASANGGVGLDASNTKSSSTTGSTTAMTSSLTSGGNMTRTAGGTITDQGTNINAGGSLTQSATAWNSEAAQNTTFSTTNSATNSAQLGLYANASASKSGGYNQNTTTTGQAPSASAGISAAYQQNTSGASSATSTAVVSNIHTGGSFTSTTTGATALQGTNVNAGGDLNLNAASLTDTAAQNTATSSNTTGNINASLQVGKGTGGYSASLAGGASALGTSSASTTAVVGSLSSGGNLNVNTTGDQTYEGTNLSAKNNATVQSSGGNVTFNAAQNTTSTSENYQGFNASLSGNQKGGAASFNGGTNSQSSASSTAVTSTVSAGNGLTIKANNALTMQGTNLASGGDTNLGANTLSYQAAQNTSSNSQASQTLNVGVSGSSGGSKGGDSGAFAGAYVNNTASGSSSTAVVGNVNAGGNLNVTTTGNQTYTGTNLSAGKDANISSTSGAVTLNQAQNSTSASSTQWGVSASASSTSGKDGGTTQQGALGGGYQTNTAATTTGIASNIKTGGNLNVTSNNDLTLQGTNIASGGNTTLQSNNGSVNYQALTSTATGSGWGVNAQVNGSDTSSGNPARFFNYLVALSTALREANITLDAVSTSDAPRQPEQSGVFPRPASNAPPSEETTTSENLALPALARVTGGRVLEYKKDLTAAISACIGDGESYYAITFDSPSAAQIGTYHSLQVAVAKPGLKTSASPGYFLLP